MSAVSSPSRRLPHVDALKAIAAQAIVLHHLLSYGPLAGAAHAALPNLAALTHEYGRLAVQIFLVIGGFLSARGLSPRGQALAGPAWPLLARRYLRLVLPFLAAVALTVLVSVVIEPVLPELVPAAITPAQVLAHATLSHDLLGFEALTVGAWYVAVDFQLFALLLGLLWVVRWLVPHPSRLVVGPVVVAGLTLASAWAFNRVSSLDATALYFFGAYGLGACVHWLSLWRHRRLGLGLLAVAVLGALAWDWRVRLALALVTALTLAWAQQRHRLGRALPLSGPGWARLSRHSYALFLVHFPVLLLANAAVQAAGFDPLATLLALPLTWLAANALAAPFHEWIEAPAARLDPSGWWVRAQGLWVRG